MNSRHLRRAAAIGAFAALGLTGVVSSGAQADGGGADRAKVATISMELKGKDIFFKGAKSVNAGDQLRILNNTDPTQIGPHTFTLVKQKNLPEISKAGYKDCNKEGVCVRVAKAHQINFKKETIGRRLVRAGKEGWDQEFGKRGDSWVSLKEGQEFSQKVSAEPGTTLYYFCDIHIEMQGKIKVK